jgi:cyclic pyranopterin phosphate synthase
MVTLVDITASMGIKRVRLTGGEPLVRRDFVSFVEQIRTLDRPLDLSLTTNGILLPDLAEELVRVGLTRVNISLDTLNEVKYEKITGSKAHSKVLNGIEAALRLGFDSVKINVVLIRGLNDDEIDSFVRMAESKPLTVRFIEFMPTGLADWDIERLIPSKEILESLKRKHGAIEQVKTNGGGPSLDYRFPGMVGKVGFISSVTEPSCEMCNRLRVTAEGRLRPCLFSEVEFDIKTALRTTNARDEVKMVTLAALRAKPKGHFHLDSYEQTGRPMAQIGG